MAAWFKPRIDDRIKALVANVVTAYIDRSELAFHLLSLEPKLTDIEMAVLWGGMSVVMEEAAATAPASGEIAKTFHVVSRDFFDSLCQDYIDKIAQSDLKLDPTSDIILKSISPTLEGISKKRREEVGTLIADIGGNCSSLAGATIQVLSAGLTRKQGGSAKECADSLLDSEQSLNPFELERAKEWLAAFSWSTS